MGGGVRLRVVRRLASGRRADVPRRVVVMGGRPVIIPGGPALVVCGHMMLVTTVVVPVHTPVIVSVPSAVVIPVGRAVVLPPAISVVLPLVIPAAIPVVFGRVIVAAVVLPASVRVVFGLLIPTAIRVVLSLVIPTAVPVSIPGAMRVVPLVSIRFTLPFALAVAAIVGQVPAEVGAVGSQATFILSDAALVLREIAPICAEVVPGLLERVDAVSQLRTMDPVVGPTADDLAKPLLQGTVAGETLTAPDESRKVLPDLRARAQRPPGQRSVLSTDDAVEYQGCRKRCHETIHDVLLCAGELHPNAGNAGEEETSVVGGGLWIRYVTNWGLAKDWSARSEHLSIERKWNGLRT
jgi:hypothetical protein